MPEEPKKFNGIELGKLVKWNSILDRIKMDDGSPFIPFSNQIAFLRSKELEVLYGGGTRGGKAESYSSIVMTPFGERLMGEVQVGELVCTPDGSSSKILQIHEQGEQDIFKVTFTDGRSVDTTKEHLWLIKKTKRNTRKGNKKEEGGWFIWDTQHMMDWMKTNNTKSNLAVPLTEPVVFTKTYKYEMKTVEPYLLGLLIGDGCITSPTKMISIAGIDDEIFQEVEKLGYEITRCDKQVLIKNSAPLREKLDKLKLLGKYAWEKNIPSYYKYAPVEDRINLMQGLMDTDGYVDSRGHLSYTTTSEQLAKDVQWVVRSLGGRASITSKIPTYTYEEVKKEGRLAYTVWIQIKDKSRLVRLSRKKERCIDCDYIDGSQEPSLTIEKIEYDRKEKARCITIMHKDGLYLTNDFTVTHNSFALLAAAAQYVDCPGYSAIIFRRTYMELSKGDGLIPLSMKWFKPFEKEGVHWNGDLYQWEWPNGAIIGFGHLDTENNKFNYAGLSYQFIGYDEVTTQPFENYGYMFSRLVRNTTQKALDIPLRVRCTTNPGGPHGQWVYERFVNKESRYAFKQEIIRQAVVNKGIKPEDITPEYISYRMPKFIPSLVKDNPFIDRTSYLDSVANMDPVLREQLLEGNWEIRAMGNMFNRAWFDRIPSAKCPPDWDLKKVRYWDLAATKNGDATVGCKLGLDQKSGLFYLMDVKILHLTPREVEREVWHCCYEDGADTTVVMEREPGSAGINNIENYKRRIIPPGWRFKEDRVSGDKMTRARPVSAAAEKKLIKIIDTRAVNRWYKTVMDQLEGFPESENDDCCDGLSGGFNFLAHKTLHTGKYIGKVDWMSPGNTYVPFGDKTETSSPLLNVLKNKRINF